MYVWFEALVNYISTLGWPADVEHFKDFWPGIQIAGKDNLRQQSAMWPAMLLSAGLQPPAQVLIHGFISSDGQKMSKSLGNGISLQEIFEKYGADVLRYLCASIGPAEAVAFSDKELVAGKRFSTKLINASRFVFMNLEDWDCKRPKNWKN